jgi:hypothetical protein
MITPTNDVIITAVAAAYSSGVLRPESVGILMPAPCGVEVRSLAHLSDEEIKDVVPSLVQAASRREYGIIRRTEVDGATMIGLYLERLDDHGLWLFDAAGKMALMDRGSPDADLVDWAAFFPGCVRPPHHEPSRN